MKINDQTSLLSNIQLRKNDKSLATSLEKIASGLRINKAADDAAGLVISDTLGSQLRGIGQSVRNANDSIAMTQVADGALGEVSSALQGMREMALQAANASQNLDSRQALQNDISGALASITSTVENTSYNGQNLLNENFTQSLTAGDLQNIDVTSQEGAQDAIAIIDEAMQGVNSERSGYGAQQNQLSSEINNLSNAYVNVSSARSSVIDVDLAEELMFMKQAEALTKAGVFAQTQTGKINQESILGILQGGS
jgi:flagellin